MREAITFLVTNQIFMPAFLSRSAKKKTEKEKAETPKAKFPTKIRLPKCPIDRWLRMLSLIW